jgi:hypothetical protein
MSVDEGWEHSLGLDQKKHEREPSHAFTDLGHVPPSEPGEPRLGLPQALSMLVPWLPGRS